MQHVFIGLLGVVALLTVAFLFSSNRKAINPRTILGALALQALVPAFVIYTDSGAATLQAISDGVQAVIDSAQTGIGFVFGPLVDVKKIGFIFAVKVLPVIIFFAALMSVLYYLKIMQVVIKVMGGGLQKLLKTSPVESLSAAANIFVGQTEAPLVVKPYLPTMTKSELFAIMSGGLASVAGAVLAGYATMGIPLNYLIAASFMAAPGGLLMAKMLEPETDTPRTDLESKIVEEQEKETEAVNVIDAAAIGASDGLKLAANVGAMLIAFVALIALLNMMVGGIGGMFGLENLTIQQMLGYLFAPVAFILGVPWEHATDVGSLLGIKLIINEFVAYIDLVKMKESLDVHSFAIATVALCGFANLSSLAILLGGLGVIAPGRRGDIARMGMKAILAGTLSNFMSATLVGIFVAIKML
ncbi:NupC/NupG family nucleoside CNT transporter [Hydrogenimonas urashimensis]|uniref:NupC/NupG family nucleoside CNT transporter n=1 Tax=Hydrogenimonas urashimensis TaxID=2740515 RepID=UPI0019167F0E|nr:NupC/NupG family nucleoside CNT transporter [Hydrogenimonas urashimensis]